MLSPTPDNDVFQHLASTYSFAHPSIHLQNDFCGHYFHENTVNDGVINGADWYATNGKHFLPAGTSGVQTISAILVTQIESKMRHTVTWLNHINYDHIK